MAEEKIKNEEEGIVHSAGEGLAAVDKDMRIIMISHQAEIMLGYSLSEAIGKIWPEFINLETEKTGKIPASDSPLANAMKEKSIINTASVPDTYYYYKKDGAKMPVSIIATPIVIEEKVMGGVVIFHDLTKEKEMERFRLDFFSLASHKLRTPLSGAKWLIETLKNGVAGKLTKKQKEYIEEIYKTNEQMIKLVTDLFSALKLENEKLSIQKENIETSNLFSEIAKNAEAAIKEKKLMLHYPDEQKKFTIETNLEALKKILLLLVSNAIDYSRSGKKIDLNVDEEKTEIIFSVKDFGIGIPKDEQNKIFEKFYRASNAKEFKQGGSGLGLYIAKMLADKIGAKILFDSEVEKGTNFYLYTPKRSDL